MNLTLPKGQQRGPIKFTKPTLESTSKRLGIPVRVTDKRDIATGSTWKDANGREYLKAPQGTKPRPVFRTRYARVAPLQRVTMNGIKQ